MPKPRVKMKIELPRFPNFLRMSYKGVDQASIPISSLSDDELEDYAEYWKQGLIEHVKNRRGL